MKYLGLLCWLLATTCLCLNVQAQGLFEISNLPLVNRSSGGSLAAGFGGGLNAALVERIHLDTDTVSDLVLFDRGAAKCFTFLAVVHGSGSYRWQYAPSYEMLLPEIKSWVRFRDYDKDGRKDIFCSTSFGVKVYRNSTPMGQLPQFMEVADYLRVPNPPGPDVNLAVLSVGLPVIDDVDLDGDVDIIGADFAAGKAEFFRNVSVENTGRPGLSYQFINNQWGNFSTNNCNICLPNGPPCRVGAVKHLGSTYLALQYDGQAGVDLMVGDISCDKINVLLNSGTTFNPNFSLGGFFPSSTNPAELPSFVGGSYEDVDFDGKRDLLLSVNINDDYASQKQDFRQSIWFYKNTGSNTQPAFSFQSKSFLQEEMVDVGIWANPAFVDIDGDGDQDLIIGNQGTVVQGASSFYKSSMSLYTNIGSRTLPMFQLTNNDWLGYMAGSTTYLNLRPVFVDLNNDGAIDMLLRRENANSLAIDHMFIPGTLGQQGYVPNIAAQVNLSTQFTNQAIFFDQLAVEDINGDGVKDLLVGRANGNIEYYTVTLQNGNPRLTLANSYFGGFVGFNLGLPNVKVLPGGTFAGIAIGDFDGNGQPDLLKADARGWFGIAPNIRATAQQQNMSFDTLIVRQEYSQLYGAYHVSAYSAPTVADLNGDGNQDVVLGCYGGGLMYFRNTAASTTVARTVIARNQVRLYPNPANASTTVEAQGAVSLRIINQLGQEVLAHSLESATLTHKIALDGLSGGVYMAQVTFANGVKTTQHLVICR